MDEAERLCDRISVIHDGRVTALDTSGGLTARIATGQVLRFRTPADLDALRALPSVSSAADLDGGLVVAGTAEVLPEAIVELSRHHRHHADRERTDGRPGMLPGS